MILKDKINKLKAAMEQKVQLRVDDRKVADPWFDSQPGNASLQP